MFNLPFLIIGAILLILIICFISKAYVKAGPSIAYIISGLTKNPRFLVGKGGFMFPFLERKDELSLAQITIDINTKEPVPTKDFIEVNIDAVAIIQISKEFIQTAAKNYIGKRPAEIGASVTQTLSGCLREAIGTVEFKELNLNRDAFSKTVMNNATIDITNLGLEILSCNIERVSDKNGLIEGLGADNTWKIKKEAALTKANSEKEIRETQARAEQQAKEAEIASLEAVAERENKLIIKRAELQKDADTHKADADAAYKIQEANQQKTINEAVVDADIARQKKMQILSEESIKIRENELAASIKKQADADKYKTEMNALAILEQETRKAEAQLVLAQKDAEAQKAKAEAIQALAKANADKIRMEGEAEAAARKALGIAEADAIKARGEAEAAALEKKAEAFDKFNNAAILDMVVKILPEMSKNVAEPLSNIQSLNIYGSDGKNATQISGNVPVLMKQTLDTFESVGIPVSDMLQAKTKSAMTDKNIGISGNVKSIIDDVTKPLNS